MPELSIDLTQWVGIAVFACAAIACLAASHARPLPWRVLAALHIACCVEVVAGTRYLVHNAMDFTLQAQGRYEGRHPVQFTLAAMTLTVALVCGLAILRRRQRLGVGLTGALIGTALTATLFAIETISMHHVDAVMYAMAGPIKAIGWLWVGVAAITTTSALRGVRESARRR